MGRLNETFKEEGGRILFDDSVKKIAIASYQTNF